jgi:hypothetical protein
MDSSKNILLILFLLLSTINFAQTTADVNCESELKTIETEIKSQNAVSYKIVFSQKLYTEVSFEFSQGIVVITNLNDNLNIDETIKVIVAIGVENKLSKMLAFKSCKAVELYFNQNRLTPEQTDYLDKNLLPKVEIDLNKSLSKKEKKQSKRKRDLIESVSKESCEKLTEFGTDKLSMESLNQIVSSTSAKYSEKTMKVYEMSFEESVDEFLKDLTNHLMFDCQVMKEFAKNYEEK